MKQVCTWCGKDMSEKEGPEDAVTHGMCEDCAVHERAKLADYQKRKGMNRGLV